MTKIKKIKRHNPGMDPPPSKPEGSIFCKTNKTHEMKVNITIYRLLNARRG